jgi:hypothetical protein
MKAFPPTRVAKPFKEALSEALAGLVMPLPGLEAALLQAHANARRKN